MKVAKVVANEATFSKLLLRRCRKKMEPLRLDATVAATYTFKKQSGYGISQSAFEDKTSI